MFKIFALSLLLGSSSQADSKIESLASTTTYTASDGCAYCLRKGHYWLLHTANMWKGVANQAAKTGMCCTSTSDTTNCNSAMCQHGATTSYCSLSSAYTGTIDYATFNYIKYTSGTNTLEGLIATCEYQQDICVVSGSDATTDQVV